MSPASSQANRRALWLEQQDCWSSMGVRPSPSHTLPAELPSTGADQNGFSAPFQRGAWIGRHWCQLSQGLVWPYARAQCLHQQLPQCYEQLLHIVCLQVRDIARCSAGVNKLKRSATTTSASKSAATRYACKASFSARLGLSSLRRLTEREAFALRFGGIATRLALRHLLYK